MPPTAVCALAGAGSDISIILPPPTIDVVGTGAASSVLAGAAILTGRGGTTRGTALGAAGIRLARGGVVLSASAASAGIAKWGAVTKSPATRKPIDHRGNLRAADIRLSDCPADCPPQTVARTRGVSVHKKGGWRATKRGRRGRAGLCQRDIVLHNGFFGNNGGSSAT